MAAAKKKVTRVVTPLAVVKLGSTELYLKRGASLPPGVETKEVARLIAVGVVETVEVEDQSTDDSIAEAAAKAKAEAETKAKAEAEAKAKAEAEAKAAAAKK